MSSIDQSGTFTLGDRTVKRLGYGAMQLAGPGVFGPPKDRDAALAVLREAVASGVNHIDTSDFYGPHVTNQIIREALHPIRDDLVIVTKIGARRGADGSWNSGLLARRTDAGGARQPAQSRARRARRRQPAHHVRRARPRRRLDRGAAHRAGRPAAAGPGAPHRPEQRHAHADRGRTRICKIVCVQNQYNLAHRDDDALIDDLARDGIAYVPFFPLGGFTPLQSSTLSDVAARLGATPMQVALAWLLRRAPNILLIPGTSSVAHLRENLAAVR